MCLRKHICIQFFIHVAAHNDATTQYQSATLDSKIRRWKDEEGGKAIPVIFGSLVGARWWNGRSGARRSGRSQLRRSSPKRFPHHLLKQACGRSRHGMAWPAMADSRAALKTLMEFNVCPHGPKIAKKNTLGMFHAPQIWVPSHGSRCNVASIFGTLDLNLNNFLKKNSIFL